MALHFVDRALTLVSSQSYAKALVMHDLRTMFDNVVSLTPRPPRSRAMPIENDLVYRSRKIAKFLEIPIETCRFLIRIGTFGRSECRHEHGLRPQVDLECTLGRM